MTLKFESYALGAGLGVGFAVFDFDGVGVGVEGDFVGVLLFDGVGEAFFVGATCFVRSCGAETVTVDGLMLGDPLAVGVGLTLSEDVGVPPGSLVLPLSGNSPHPDSATAATIPTVTANARVLKVRTLMPS